MKWLSILHDNKAIEKYRREWIDKNMQKNGPNALDVIIESANHFDADFWFAWGSVLACYRDHGFIKGDNDIDIGMLPKDLSEDFVNRLINNGFEFVYGIVNSEYRGFHVAFNYKNVKIDFYTCAIDNSEIRVYGPWAKKEEWNDSFRNGKFSEIWANLPFSGFNEVDFLGRKIKIYSNADEILRLTYGDDFMTPIPGKKAQSSNCISKPEIEESYSELVDYKHFVKLKRQGLI